MKKLLVLNILIAIILEFCIKFFFTKQFTDEGILIWNLIPYWKIILFSIFIGLIGYFNYLIFKNFLKNKILFWLLISVINGIIFYLFNYAFIHHFSKMYIFSLIIIYLIYWYIIIYKFNKQIYNSN